MPRVLQCANSSLLVVVVVLVLVSNLAIESRLATADFVCLFDCLGFCCCGLSWIVQRSMFVRVLAADC